jgi:hypothetical protein
MDMDFSPLQCGQAMTVCCDISQSGAPGAAPRMPSRHPNVSWTRRDDAIEEAVAALIAGAWAAPAGLPSAAVPMRFSL